MVALHEKLRPLNSSGQEYQWSRPVLKAARLGTLSSNWIVRNASDISASCSDVIGMISGHLHLCAQAPVSFKTAMSCLVFCGWHDQYGLLKTYFQISPNHSFSNWCINFRYIYQVPSWITYLTLCSSGQLFSNYNKSLSMVWLEIGLHYPRVVISSLIKLV